MSPIVWRTLPVVALAGCTRFTERPYDARIACRSEGAPVLSTVADAIAVVDANGDGALTDADVRAGETVIIVGLSGTHLSTGEASEPGYTILTDWDAFLFAFPDEFAYWGVEVTCNCLPMLKVFVNFDDASLPPEALPAGNWAVRGLGIDVISHEMSATDSDLDASVRVTNSEGDRASGYLMGSGSSAFLRLIPEEAPTGQRLSVEAFAFREILNREAE